MVLLLELELSDDMMGERVREVRENGLGGAFILEGGGLRPEETWPPNSS